MKQAQEIKKHHIHIRLQTPVIEESVSVQKNAISTPGKKILTQIFC